MPGAEQSIDADKTRRQAIESTSIGMRRYPPHRRIRGSRNSCLDGGFDGSEAGEGKPQNLIRADRVRGGHATAVFVQRGLERAVAAAQRFKVQFRIGERPFVRRMHADGGREQIPARIREPKVHIPGDLHEKFPRRCFENGNRAGRQR